MLPPFRRFVLIAALALAVPAAVCAQAPALVRTPGAAEVRLRPGDAVRIAVKNEPALSGDYPVAADGTVMLPVLGLARIADRAFHEVGEELRSRYARELAEPEVQLTPLVRVAVLGEVRNPGLFLVDPTHAMRDVIALAGGLTPSAKRSKIEIGRGGQTILARYEGGSDDLELSPRSGDEVFVPRRSWLSDNLGIFIGAAASVAVAAVTSWIVR